jgi:hypothetical protein
MAKERRRSDRGGKASRSATGVGLSAQAGNKAPLDDGRRSGRRARRSPLTGRIVARRSALSSELRLVGCAARASEVERASRSWPTTSRTGRSRPEGPISIAGPPRTERHPFSALRLRKCARHHRSSAGIVKCRRPARAAGPHRPVRAWESMDPLVLVRERRLSRFEKDASCPVGAWVERPLSRSR